MRYLFLLNPAAGKQDCTVQLIPQIRAAAARAGWSEADYTIHTTEYAGYARELARAAAQEAAQAGDSLRIWTAGGDGTFMEAMTGVQGFANAAWAACPTAAAMTSCAPMAPGGVHRPRCPAGGRGSDHRPAGDQSGPVRHHLRGGSGRTGGLRHPQVPAPSPCRGGEVSTCSPSWSSSAGTSAAGSPLPSTTRS